MVWCGVVWCSFPYKEGQRISMCGGMMPGPEAPSPTCCDRSAQHHEGVWSSSTRGEGCSRTRGEGRSAPSATNSKSLRRALCRSSICCRRWPNCRTISAAGGRQGPAIVTGPGPFAARACQGLAIAAGPRPSAAGACQVLSTAPTAGNLEPEVTSNVTAAPKLAALNAYTHPVRSSKGAPPSTGRL